MKFLWIAAALSALAGSALAADVGVSISIGQPGFYGRIVLGEQPPPRVIYSAPVVIRQSTVQHRPIYLRVPPGHEKKWSKHCARYNACGQPVYFVRNDWYQNDYVPYYQSRSSERGGEWHDQDRRGDEHRRGHDGHPKNRGNGHGRGHD